MRLSEHQSKELFREAGIAVPAGVLVARGGEIKPPADIPPPWYLKAQVLSGGRGKAGGVTRVDVAADLRAGAAELFAKPLCGVTPPFLRLEAAVELEREFYISLTLSRDRRELVLAVSDLGGVDVESAGEEHVLTQCLPLPGPALEHQLRSAFFHLGVDNGLWPAFREFVQKLHGLAASRGLLLAEVNPLALTPDGRFLALDGKIELDDNMVALDRELERFFEPAYHVPEDVAARAAQLSFVKLSGWVGCMVNGAGLAMATMDLLNFAGLPAANFLDLGGAADAERIKTALGLLFDDVGVRAVFVNLYGGILSCERVAEALIRVLDGKAPEKPLVVRMAGNGERTGRERLASLAVPGVHVVEDMARALAVLADFGPRATAPERVAAVPIPRAARRPGIPRSQGFGLGADARVLVQGITGKVARLHTRLMREYGTRVVAGVTPFKGGQEAEGVPVYDSVHEALREHEIDASIVFVPAGAAPDAVLEAAEAGIPWVVCITEGIPQMRMLAALKRLASTGARLVGPNTPGLIVPGALKIGIMPADPFSPGPVAIFSRSGTLTYEAAARLTSAGIGQAFCVGIGGDPFGGVGYRELLDMACDDSRVEAVLVIGEIGGRAEEDLARYILASGYPKPVLAFVAGQTAPPGRRLGHAGAILDESGGGVAGKLDALAEAGVTLCPDLQRLPELVRKTLV